MKHPVVLIGAQGKLGTLVALELAQSDEFELVQKILRTDSPAAVPSGALVIDAAAPVAAHSYLPHIQRAGGRLMVLGSGFGSAERQVFEAAARDIPVLIAPNTSKALWAFRSLVAQAAQLLGSEFEASIFEAHHSAKRDAPSGTALVLQEALLKLGHANVAVASARYGDVPGEHTVFLGGAFERIELTHRVRDRRLFARGAVQLAGLFMKKGAGYYTPADLWSVP